MNRESWIKKILAAVGKVNSAAPRSSFQATEGPYKESTTNYIYQLQFCDRPELHRKHHTGAIKPPWSTLFADPPDLDAIGQIAEERSQESRVRMLAFNKLRLAGIAVPKKIHFGTIIEVGYPGGLDTLAAFADGGARYINQSGKMIFVEGRNTGFDPEVLKVIEASQPIVAAIGPWKKDRLPAPKEGNLRMTFLVSDGLYFGEGKEAAMGRDRMAAPLISAATVLLQKLIKKASESEQGRAPGNGGAN